MSVSNFFSITYFPDGRTYDKGDWNISDLLEYCPSDLSRFITFDSIKRNEIIYSPIGQLEFVWSASKVFGVSTLLKDGVTINTALFLPGNDVREEAELFQYYLSVWRGFDVVKDLCGEHIPFQEAEAFNDRPFMVSVNWATIDKSDYEKIAYYDVFMASEYFMNIRQPINKSKKI